MTDEILLDELNELAECNLCPMDLMDSIDGYANQRVVDELEELKDWEDELPFGVRHWIDKRIKELKQYI